MTRRRLITSGLLAASVAAAALLPGAASAAAPTDPQAAQQEPLRLMHVPEALDLIARPLADVPVLVADTGLDLDHPDIAPRLFSLPAPVAAPNPDGVGDPGTVAAGRAGWDLIGTTHHGALRPDADPSDPDGYSGHGTAVAGLLGAAWNNGQGGAGVAPNARFVALRTCWDGDECYQYVQAAAIDWAADRGARVASFSWLSGPLEESLRAAILNHPNMLFVTIPSGNGGAYDADGESPQPCGLDAANVLCVSTSSPTDGLDCGAYGPRSVDVAVPTQNSITTTNGGGFGPSGCATSYASPTAAGLATILFGIDPTATAADVRAAIVDSARKAPEWAGKSTSGGIADAQAAVALFQQRRGIAPGTPPPGTPALRPIPQPGPNPAPQRDRTRPTITVRVNRFGTVLTFRLSEPARVRLVFERRIRGRKTSGGRCTPGKRIGRFCTISVTEGEWAQSVPQSVKARKVALDRLRKSNGQRMLLRNRRYSVSVTATDAAGNRSRFSVGFTKTR